VSRESFRRDINREFDAISGAPSPALSARVRSALSEQAAARSGPFWIAGLAAGLIAAIVIGLFVVANFNRHQTGVAPGGPLIVSPSAVATATPDAALPGFGCTSSGLHIDWAQPPTTAFIDAVRTGTHTGYDRITIEVKSGQLANINVDPQNNTTFTQGASGQTITLKGNAGLLVTIHGADEHTSYNNGPTDIKPGYSVLLEARQVQDFEGTVQWALGLSKPACYRAFFLGNPQRLVIDIQTGT
jgi:hypothetical protein